MAPRNDATSRRNNHHGGRNAHTGAGVNANRTTAARDRITISDTTSRRIVCGLSRSHAVLARNAPHHGSVTNPTSMIVEPDRTSETEGHNRAANLTPQKSRGGNVQDHINNNNNGNSSIGDGPAIVQTSQIAPFLPTSPVLPTASTSAPIRMFNKPLNEGQSNRGDKRPRPKNNYRGKDPIKKMVQNKKLQAIFAGKPIPKERKKVADERPDLRMAISKIYK